MYTPRTLDREVDVFTWSLDATPDVVREFDWEDGEAGSPSPGRRPSCRPLR